MFTALADPPNGVAGSNGGATLLPQARSIAQTHNKTRIFVALFSLTLWSAGAVFSGPARGADTENPAEIEIAAALGVTGNESTFGQGSLEGVQFAIEEANAAKTGPRIKLVPYDDHSDDGDARSVAEKIVESPAVLVLGPDLSTKSIAAGPIYAAAGLASLTTTATSDLITDNSTTFRIVFKNSDQGELLATYVGRVLGSKKATVIYPDDGNGRSLVDGFRRAADRLGLTTQYFALGKPQETEQQIAKQAAEAPDHPPVILLMLDSVGARLVPLLRRLGVTGPILGSDSFGYESFCALLGKAPEEQKRPGALSDEVYGLSPMILDSANAKVQEFAKRFRKRFGHDPVWFSTAGYDAASVAIDTLRTIGDTEMGRDQMRAAILDQLNKLNSPATAISGLLGPLWFDEHHGRQQAIRIGRFKHSKFESSPVQIVPVTTPDTSEIVSGAVFEMAPGRYARLQRVIYTGVYVNEISRIDLARSSFDADFYVWMRYSRNGVQTAVDPTDLTFPNLLSSSSISLNQPAEQRDMPDGITYRLWRVQGEFHNDFDLHQYPFDRQDLALSFFNARAAVDRIVYVIDSQTSEPSNDHGIPVPGTGGQNVSPTAFRNLSQWSLADATPQRNKLVTESALGDPTKAGVEGRRELSGFNMAITVQRHTFATLTKSLLPLGLMILIMFGSLFFPQEWVSQKITVATGSALPAAVLLTAIDTQLGGVGYTIAIEYVFYIFFGLSVLCVVSALSAEHFRIAGRLTSARHTELWTKVTFAGIVALTAAWAASLAMTTSGTS